MNYCLQTSPAPKETRKQILSGMFIAVISFVLICCSSVYSSQRISVTSLGNYWKINVGYYAQVSITPQDTLKDMSRTVISFGLSNIIKNNNDAICKETVLQTNNNIDHLNFSMLADERMNLYSFNNAKTYLIKNGKRYNLQPINSNNINVSKTTISINNGLNRSFYFKSPLVCSDIDGAVWEISGFFKNGVELPPIQFKTNIKQ